MILLLKPYAERLPGLVGGRNGAKRWPILALLLLLVGASTVRADIGDSSARPRKTVVCGTAIVTAADRTVTLANTARLHPALYRKMMAGKRLRDAQLSGASDDRHTFNVYNGSTDSYDEITGRLAFTGRYVRIWVDTQATDITPAVILQLARGLDTATIEGSRNPNQGIIQNDLDVFGPVPLNTWKGDHMTEFLLTDIQDDIVDGDLLGFFNPADQDPDDPASNQMNILYIDSKEGLQGGLNELLSTVAHEFQHLLHFARNPGGGQFYNEGCSEEASILNGYMDRGNPQFMANTNIDLFHWSLSSSMVTADYERAMTFMHYLHEQFGDQFLYDFVGEMESEIDRIDWTLLQVGSSLTSTTVLENFAVANLLKTSQVPAYAYRNPIQPSATPRMTRTYTLPIAASDMIYSIERLGSLYLAYTNPSMLAQGVKLRLGSNNGFLPFTAIAILYRDTMVTVRRLGGAGEYTLGDSRPYDRIVLAIVNASSYSQEIEVTAQPVTLGVDALSAEDDGSAMLDLLPNPSRGATTFRFASSGSAPATMKIFDARGEEVSTVLDGERFESGTHQVIFDAGNLPSGSYVVRFTQGMTRIFRSMIVVR